VHIFASILSGLARFLSFFGLIFDDIFFHEAHGTGHFRGSLKFFFFQVWVSLGRKRVFDKAISTGIFDLKGEWEMIA
jgi:hypothetical protein